MWPFGRRVENHPPTTGYELSPGLEARLAALEKAHAQRELEWSDWFDKFRRLYARIARRMERAADENPDAPQSPQDAPESTKSHPPAGYGHPALAARRRAMRGF